MGTGLSVFVITFVFYSVDPLSSIFQFWIVYFMYYGEVFSIFKTWCLWRKKKTWKLKRTTGDFFAKYLFLAFTEVKQNEEFLMLPAEMFKCFEPRSLTYLFVPKILKIKINLNKAKAEVEKLLDLSLRPYIIFTDMLQSTGHKQTKLNKNSIYWKINII